LINSKISDAKEGLDYILENIKGEETILLKAQDFGRNY